MKKSVYFAFHSITLMEKMKQATDRNDGITATVLAGAVCETFLNDMQRFFQHGVDYRAESLRKYEEDKTKPSFRKSKVVVDLSFFKATTELETKLAEKLSDLEKPENQCSTADKYAAAIELIKNTNESGTSRIQELRRLFDIRNDIVHSKGLTIDIPYDENNNEIAPTRSDYPDFLRPLFKQNILVTPPHHDTWLYLLDTKSYCRWIKKTVVNSMYYILENLDKESPMSKYFEDSFYVYERKSG
ncbi:hypothetical protein [Vibrio parahaemolyticus]|uniref:hypothetical protein n=2 Tax=Vibrio parahaemolyticus TaxID=670 RepID=UPI002553E92C|nr:hypothetical protein [Vibrio parahaemolyticus]EKB1953097.1 hypothetical protein [Vibrio parahaemolyticus]MDK9426430.1 hypothetical protein [Vibrio parahaemolyticus]MDK9437996.1 hypothetical protein [Vibrio parahaemolyticus]